MKFATEANSLATIKVIIIQDYDHLFHVSILFMYIKELNGTNITYPVGHVNLSIKPIVPNNGFDLVNVYLWLIVYPRIIHLISFNV